MLIARRVTRPRSVIRTVLSVLLGALLAAMPAPTSLAASGSAPCLVRNVTQDSQGRSFKAMVGAAHNGDRLRVHGMCRARGVVLDKHVLIRGADGATLDAGGHGRVLRVRRGRIVTLRRLVIMGGDSPGSGGAIFNAGSLSLIDSVVRGNRSRSVREGGGGIFNQGTLSVTGSVLRGNHAANGGGGIWNEGGITLVDSDVRANVAIVGGGIFSHGGGTLAIVDSIVQDNSAGETGGGIFNGSGGTTAIIESVVRGNSAGETGGEVRRGGGIHNEFALTIIDSIVEDNSAGETGGGLFNNHVVTLVRAIVRGNSAGKRGGGIYNNGGTVIADDSSVAGNQPDDCFATPGC